MKFVVDPKIFDEFPGVKLGVVVGLKIDNTGIKPEINKLLKQWQEKQAQAFQGLELATHKRIAPWRGAYLKFGVKPSKYLSSIESLLKRVTSGSTISYINPLVDLYNAMSFKYVLPFGAEDLDTVKGDIRLSFADGTERGKYIGYDIFETCQAGEVAYLDELGFICRRWNWREGDRTKITPDTQNFFLVAEALPPVDSQELEEAISEFTEFAQKNLGGKYATAVVDVNNSSFEVDFVTGSKVSETVMLQTMPSGESQDQGRERASVKVKRHESDLFGIALKISKSMEDTIRELNGERVEIQLEHPANFEHGDYSSNVAMRIGPMRQMSPINFAKALQEKLLVDEEIKHLVEKIDVAPPGFINFWLSKEELSRQLQLALSEGERYGKSKEGSGKTIVIDYSSPNIAKRFGIGHLRSTIIGQTLCNLYRFLGYRVISDNHLGDWGTQFGAIIAELKSQMSKVKSLADLTVSLLEELYVNFNRKAHDKPELWDEARMWFKKLEDGDKEARAIWEACVKVSMEEFNRIYKLLGVKFDYCYGESFYQDKMASVIEEAKKKQLAVKDQGALVIKYPDALPPGILVKSDGATTYLMRDLAAIKFRLNEWQPDKILYEVGAEQSLHFQQLFKTVEILGWAKQDQFVHVKHGLYLSTGGKKFSTRKGETVNLEEVLLEAVERAGKLGKGGETAKAVGVGAIKYFDLSHHPESPIVFSWEKMFLLTGNSGPYLQYTYARCCSILRRANWTNLSNWTNWTNLQPDERALLRTFYRFPEIIHEAVSQYAPNLLCNFLYDLASKYNRLYNNISILGAEERQKQFRLALTAVTAQTLKTGLILLGIAVPEKM